jgi:hypothetical protein
MLRQEGSLMNKTMPNRHLLITAAALAAVLCLFELTSTVVTMLGAWLIILVIYRLVGGGEDESQAEIQSVS